MVNYGLKNKVALITGANNPQGIGAATAFAFAREGAKVVLIYKRIHRSFDKSKTDKNGTDRYFEANSGNAVRVESRLKEMDADYLIMESDISDEAAVKEIYRTVLERYGKVDILVNIALEVARYGVTVNCVAPGPTQTGWIDTDLEQSVLPIIPMGKLIQPEDLAETILFLASEQARMLTGQVIKVSGGHAL